MARVKCLLKYLGLILLGLILSVVVIELTLRLYNPFGFRVRGDKIALQTNLTKVIINKKIAKLDEKIIHRRNSLGLRGEEPPLDFNNYLTIITVGGSTTECLYLSEGKTWSDRLAARLQEKIEKVWVNNAGFDGYSTFGNIILMRDYIVDLQPDIVLFLIGANDIGLKAPNPITDEKIMQGGKFRGEENATAPSLCFSSFRCLVTSLAYHSEFVNLVLNLYRYTQASQLMPGENDIVKVIHGGVGHIQLDPQELGRRQLSEDEMETVLEMHRRDYIPAYWQRVEELVRLSREHGVEPVLMTQPALYGAAVDDVSGVDLSTVNLGDHSNGLLEWRLLELYNDVLREVGPQQGLLVIDLAQMMPKSSRYYYDFMHYTNEGADKMAEIIFEKLYPFLQEKGFSD